MTLKRAQPILGEQIVSLLAAGPSQGRLRVRGWVRSCRSSKHVAFLALSDGSTQQTLQVVIAAQLPGRDAWLPKLTAGASVEVHGVLVASPAQGQSVELHAEHLEMLGEADVNTYPLQKKGHSLEFLRSVAHLRARSNTFGAVFRIRGAVSHATHLFFAQQGFVCVQTPIITASDCEGAGEMFEVGTSRRSEPFFGRPAMLTVSGQLNGEALAYGLGRIYTFGPTFRAENSNTVRHLSEFWMVEPEMAFATLGDNCALAEAYLKFCIAHVLAHQAPDVAFLAKHYEPGLAHMLQQVVDQPFVTMTYTEAIGCLEKSSQSFTVAPRWGMDLQTEHERALVEQQMLRPVVVTDYPRHIKAFYMYQNDDQNTVRAMDILVPRLGEIIGGSQREHRLERLQARLHHDGMDVHGYQWYLDLHRYGAVPHAGFGLGLERLVMFCTGMANIRDVIPFPRAPGLAAF